MSVPGADRTRTGCWFDAEGEGPVVVLLHGTMDRASSFARVARALPDWRVVRTDRRGYGRSVEAGPPTGFGDQVEDLVAVLDASSPDAPAVVFGHSYGGTVALATAAAHPSRIAGVVAYECPTPWVEWWPTDSAGAAAIAQTSTPEDAAEAFMRRMVGDDRWRRLPRSTRDARRAEGPTLVAELAQLRSPNPPGFDPARIAVPVLAAHGTSGAPHHARAVEWIANAAPRGELAVVEGASHGIHLTHPGDAAELVRRVARTRG